MAQHRENLDRWFDYSVYVPKRLIYIGDDVGSEVDAGMLELAVKGLTFLDSWAETPITIYLNTLGGDWYHGMAIYDLIRSLRSHITIIVVGYACSMGSLLLQAADLRVMGPHSVMMIHDGTEFLHSDSKSVEAWAKKSRDTRKEMYAIYHERIQMTRSRFTMKQVEALCSHDRIFTPLEAISYGLADQILEKNS